MSAAASTDRNQESIGNTMGAPGVDAQQKLEQQAALVSTSSGQQNAEDRSGQQPASSRTLSQQVGENESSQQQPKS